MTCIRLGWNRYLRRWTGGDLEGVSENALGSAGRHRFLYGGGVDGQGTGALSRAFFDSTGDARGGDRRRGQRNADSGSDDIVQREGDG